MRGVRGVRGMECGECEEGEEGGEGGEGEEIGPPGPYGRESPSTDGAEQALWPRFIGVCFPSRVWGMFRGFGLG